MTTGDPTDTGSPPTYLVEPAALAAGSYVSVGDHTLRWNPWARPVLLDPRTEAILSAFDGAPIDELAEALAEVEQRPVEHVSFELAMVARNLAGHGLLVGSRQRPRWCPSAMNRPITTCDRTAWNLDDADVFDLVEGGRRITCIVGDGDVAAALREQDRFEVAEAPEELAFAPIELILAVEDTPRGVHRLFGRAGRVLARSTDRDEVVRAFFSQLDALVWTRHDARLVWLDALALLLPGGGTALLPARVLYDWARMARPLERAGIVALESPIIAIDVVGGVPTVVAPGPPDPAIEALARACVGDDRPLRREALADLTVRRVDLIATDEDVAALREHGHDPDDLGAPLTAQRLALLAYGAALDRFPEDPPAAEVTGAMLEGVAALAGAPGVRARVHTKVMDLVSSLTEG